MTSEHKLYSIYAVCGLLLSIVLGGLTAIINESDNNAKRVFAEMGCIYFGHSVVVCK